LNIQYVDYQRWLGYCQALDEENIPYESELVLQGGQTMVSGYYTAQKIYNRLDDISAERNKKNILCSLG